MMYSPELSMALAHRQRHRASTSARKRSPLHGTSSERSLLTSISSSDRMSFSSRKSRGFDANDTVDPQHFPLAIKYLDQVTLKLSVTKRHADVRYVMTVRHNELNVAWRHARSFDEYRKLQQRLLKKLQHGHFCDADCPWLYGFLKSYFPKKSVFTVSSARVVEQRKQTLERFFAVLYGFLTEKKNFCCSVVMTVFADELVEFIYGDALQQYGFENPIKSAVLETDMVILRGGNSFKWKKPATPLMLHLLGQELEHQHEQQYDRQSSLTNSLKDSMTDGNIVNDINSGNCGICGSPLCGVAHGTSASDPTTLLLDEDINNSNRLTSSMPPLSRTSSNSSNNNRGVFAPPWLGTLTTNGSGGSGSANNFGGRRRSKSSASRRRAATYYLTTLSCSHQFHDECIVPKLNETLKCPTCGRIQIND